MEYLYQQTGRVLEDVSLDPDTPDEDPAIVTLEAADGGNEDDVEEDAEEDPTIFGPDTLSSSSNAAAQSGDPADTPGSEPSASAAPDHEAPAPRHSSHSEVICLSAEKY